MICYSKAKPTSPWKKDSSLIGMVRKDLVVFITTVFPDLPWMTLCWVLKSPLAYTGSNGSPRQWVKGLSSASQEDVNTRPQHIPG